MNGGDDVVDFTEQEFILDVEVHFTAMQSAMLVVLTFPKHACQVPVCPLTGPGSKHRPHTKRHTELQIMQRRT